MADHEARIEKLEDRMDTVDKRLATGDVGFAELRKDIGALTEKVGALLNAAWWLIGIIVVGVLTTTGGVVLWGVARMGTP